MTDLDKQKQKAAEDIARDIMTSVNDFEPEVVPQYEVDLVLACADWAIGVMGEELEEANLNYKEADVLRMDAEAKCDRYEKALYDLMCFTRNGETMRDIIDEALRKDG